MFESPYKGFNILFILLALCCIFWWKLGSNQNLATLLLCVCLFLGGFCDIMAALDD